LLLLAGTPTGSSAALGAYILLKEIAAQEPAAPSWQFLQQRWAAVRASAAAAGAPASQAGDAAAAAGSAMSASQAASGQAAAASSAGLAEEAAALLLVISETAAGFPAEQAQALAAELLQVGCGGCFGFTALHLVCYVRACLLGCVDMGE
jgi:hypothetical protein